MTDRKDEASTVKIWAVNLGYISVDHAMMLLQCISNIFTCVFHHLRFFSTVQSMNVHQVIFMINQA